MTGGAEGTHSRSRVLKMAAAKDGCGLAEAATGNGRRLHLGIPEAVFVVRVPLFLTSWLEVEDCFLLALALSCIGGKDLS